MTISLALASGSSSPLDTNGDIDKFTTRKGNRHLKNTSLFGFTKVNVDFDVPYSVSSAFLSFW